MSTLQEIEWEEPLLEPRRDRQLERLVRKTWGGTPPGIEYLYACPWVVRAFFSLNLRDRMLVHLEPDLVDLMWLVVSQENSFRYCYATHRALLHLIGFPEQRILRLEQSLFTAELDPRERSALDFARRLSRSNPRIDPDDVESLRETGYGRDAIKEVVFIAAWASAQNRISTLPALPARRAERMGKGPLIRLARPLVRRMLLSRSGRGRSQPLPPEDEQGPFAYLVRAYAGLPVALGLRKHLEHAWAPSAVSRRTKALVVAVVARGLGSARAEREAVRLLTLEGLEETAVEQILEHLGSPALDALEACAVPFARETIWYHTSDIQRRARALRDQITPEQFLEVAGIASLANMVGRLEIAAEIV